MTSPSSIRSHKAEIPRSGVRDQPGWVASLGRIGIASRGIIYLLLGYLAFDIARHGSAPAQTDSTGALQELQSRPDGELLLLVLAAGLASYTAWRIFDAVTGIHGAVKRFASLAIAIVYGTLCARALELAAGHPTSGGASNNPQPWVERVMSWPGGSVLLDLVGLALCGAGVVLGVWGLVHKYDKELTLDRSSEHWRTAVRIFGGLGNVARGTLIALVGLYLVAAAQSSNPAQAKSVDQALEALVQQRHGPVIIGVLAIGLLGFGIYSFLDARYRKL